MKCHYEVLSIPRDAEEAEIKTAYKKLALKWHPDKNLDNPEEAKEQFQIVQQAYEVLSDRQERAWYDNHREQILHGANKDYEDKSLDVFQYFTTSCFKGYNDEPNGFYTVYRKVFQNIAQEDLEFMDNKDEFTTIPSFGTSQSDYETSVGPFYNYWMSYSTKKSFVWLDPYNIKETRERRVVKIIEKENKKVRAKAKKERNEEVRNLVAFIRKRDRRVQAHSKKIEEKLKENKIKQEELNQQRRADRRKEIRNSNQAEWAKFDNVKSELEEIEKSLAEEFGEEISNSEEESEEEILNNLYCVACNKVFKTPKAFENHESSKKHKENVLLLKNTMLEEEEDFLEEEDYLDDEVVSCTEILTDEENLSIDEVILSDNDEEPQNTEEKKAKKKNKKPKNIIADSDEEVLPDLTADVAEALAPKKQRKKPKKKSKDKNDIKPTTAISEENEEAVPISNNKKPKKNKKQSGCLEEVLDGTLDKNHFCVTCSSKFDSKNKLFEHLKKTGHSVYIPKGASNVKMKKGIR